MVSQVQLWYNLFKEGWEGVNGDAPPVRPPTTSTTDENIKAVKKMILDKRRITITEVADDVGNIVRLMSSNLNGCFRH